jgi:16S rRNA (guanine966-N2)-methyltransferase
MRIVAGKYRGTRLVTPQSNTRPSSDRLKESLFNTLGQSCAHQKWLDLFAGSGAIALEALSRGASFVVMNDQSIGAISAIKANIKKMNVEQQSMVLNLNAKQACQLLNQQKYSFDIIFCDPPYNLDIQDVLNEIMASYLVKHETKIIIEQAKGDREYIVSEGFAKIKERVIGQSMYRIYEKQGETL